MSVKENVELVEERITNARERGGFGQAVTTVAVTKYVSTNTAQQALDFGIRHLGESRTEGLVEKQDALQGREASWHFIGQLQSRKVKDVVNRIDYLHSLDRRSLAKEIQKRYTKDESLRCFVQVNVSGEASKSGLHPEEAISFVESLAEFDKIEVVGLMTMAPYTDDPEQTRPYFKQLKELQSTVQSHKWQHAPCTELSMGMSNDFELAIEEGATYIRLGSTLVGDERNES
ncbi:hypothetical protein JCM19037_3066 [Geomicrobium sp. JCM 19037]|uniref:YggS family pyridoxal phosphate-dependent enzyme n=1 Tax=unclassified Geomicrobium TaxID=2628951 RepID=UPI00045F29CA|nr:YggS family pyridoxal phosphate-dependent enzyme [Geomicrobium sp. JCM 19037]GAK04626.1 hypothetical protein JCM19037_3066 [Geomicrobium sp. JCM 19037]